MRVDLHCHSTHSDGTWSVNEILGEAEKKGVKCLSITDHDNFNGSLEAFQIREGLYSGKLIPGIEISTKIIKQSVHLLAYFPHPDLDLQCELFQNLAKIRDSRVWRMKEMIKKANSFGLDISFEEVLKEAGTGIDGSSQPIDVLSRPHLARILVKKNYVKNFDEAFDKYLADGKSLYVSRFSLTIKEWVEQVKNVYGLLIWAHPFQGHKEKLDKFMKLTKIMENAGINGVEKIYNYKGKYDVSENFIGKCIPILDDMIKRNDWLITAGGDFHGNVGTLGELDLPEKNYNEFLNKLN